MFATSRETLTHEGYKETSCSDHLSYYKPSSLYNVEKRSNSPRAAAYSIILANSDRLRVLFDYSSSISDAKIKIVLTNTMSRTIDLAPTDLKISVSGIEQSQVIDSINLKPGESKFVETSLDLSSASMDELKANFSLGSEACLAEIPQFINLRRENKQDGFVANITNNDETRLKKLNRGTNYLGFSDYRLTSNLNSQNVGVYSYDGAKKSWVKSSVIEPGRGYVAYSSKPKTEDVVFENPFWINQDNYTRRVGSGWNLMYNNFGKDVSLDEYTVSFFQDEDRAGFYDTNPKSIATLQKSRYISNKIYLAESGDLKELDSNIIPDASVFWLYVFSSPSKIELKPIGLDFKLEGVGDTYKHGQNINFNFVVVNLDSNSREIVASGIKDPCSYGIRISNSSGKIIYDDLGKRVCPLWPLTTALQSKGKINYNYTWKVPASASGKYRIEAYFDNFRGVSGDPIKKESLINIE
jgi:hypothetical protein